VIIADATGGGTTATAPSSKSGACAAPLTYPAGPYGFTAGATLGDATFQGFANAQVDYTAPQHLSFHDFYNPHADDPSYQPAGPECDDRLFPPGSPYGAGTKKPVALLVDIGAPWAGPCNAEAKSLLNGKYAMYEPCGGEFFYQLAEGANPGVPPDESLLQTWATNYKVEYPITYDPSRELEPFYQAGFFPAGVVVDTRTMKIVYLTLGVPDAAFWQTFESQLDKTRPLCTLK
jgi:hypothetical protein